MINAYSRIHMAAGAVIDAACVLLLGSLGASYKGV